MASVPEGTLAWLSAEDPEGEPKEASTAPGDTREDSGYQQWLAVCNQSRFSAVRLRCQSWPHLGQDKTWSKLVNLHFAQYMIQLGWLNMIVEYDRLPGALIFPVAQPKTQQGGCLPAQDGSTQ